MTPKEKKELLAFMKDHYEEFECLPVEFTMYFDSPKEKTWDFDEFMPLVTDEELKAIGVK